MRIIVENGVLTIKGTQAERKAFESVQYSLSAIAEYGGGKYGDMASECRDANTTFLEGMKDVIQWAPERVKPVAT